MNILYRIGLECESDEQNQPDLPRRTGYEKIARLLQRYRFQNQRKRGFSRHRFFDNKGTKLELYPIDELAKDIDTGNPPAVPKAGFCGITLACNVKSEREVDEFMELVERHGGTIAKKPEKVFWGGYSGYFQDPDGYYWEVAYAESWKFDDNEMLVIE